MDDFYHDESNLTVTLHLLDHLPHPDFNVSELIVMNEIFGRFQNDFFFLFR